MPRRLHDYSASASELVARLRAAGCVFAEDEAQLLVDAAQTSSDLDDLATRRVAGEPLEHIVGWALFYGRRVRLGRGVFVPRPRSELLVEQVVTRLGEIVGRRAVVVDMCCGSGAIGLAVATSAAGAVDVELHACDIDPVAATWAIENLRDLDAHTYVGDLFDPLPLRLQRSVDVVVANVPYVPTSELSLLPSEARDHEPIAALDGGPDGLDVLRSVADAARRWLRAGGYVLVETSERQEPVAVDVLYQLGFDAASASSSESSAVVVTGRWQEKFLHT